MSPFQKKQMDIAIVGEDNKQKAFTLAEISFDLASYAGGQKTINLTPTKPSKLV